MYCVSLGKTAVIHGSSLNSLWILCESGSKTHLTQLCEPEPSLSSSHSIITQSNFLLRQESWVPDSPGTLSLISPLWRSYHSIVPAKPISHYKIITSPSWVAQLVGASSCTPKGCRFDSRSRHLLRLQVQSPFWVHTGGNQLMFLSLSLPPSLPL